MRVWVKPKRCPDCGGKLYNIETHRCYVGDKDDRILVTVYFECECQYCGWKGLIFPNEKKF